MWIFRVKRPPGSPLVFKSCYVARGFRQRQGVNYFQTFSPTPTLTTIRVLLHVAAQCDYELQSLDFSTAFLRGSLHEEIWLRHPPGFTGSFPASPQWSLRRPVYGLRQAPREWHDTQCDGAPCSTHRHVAAAVLRPRITRDRARPTITLTQSHMVHQVLQRFGFQFSSPQPTPLSTGHSLSAPHSDESVEPSGPYPELVGFLMVLRYLCSTSGMGLVVGGRGPVVLTGHADACWVDDSATQQSSHNYTFSLGSGSVSWRCTRSSSVLSSSCEAEIYAGAMAAQELRWLTYLLTDLGEQPRSPPVLYVDNKAIIALCQEHRLEHRTKHIALRYFLARELQQRGQLRLAYIATRANTADIFTKTLPPALRSSSAFALTPIRALPPLRSAAAARRASPSAPSRGVAVAPRAVIAGLQVSAASAAQWAARMAAFYLLVKLGVAGAEKAGGAESTGGINLVDRVNKALFGNAAEKAAKEAKKAAGSRWHESTKGTLVRRCRVPNVSEGRRTLRSLMALLSEDDLFTDVTSHKGCQIRRETAHSETVCCNNVRAMFDELPTPHIVVEVTVFPPGPLTAMEYQK
ncbi:unnamed protein product, partial [Closterium sp. NIES-54]